MLNNRVKLFSVRSPTYVASAWGIANMLFGMSDRPIRAVLYFNVLYSTTRSNKTQSELHDAPLTHLQQAQLCRPSFFDKTSDMEHIEYQRGSYIFLQNSTASEILVT